MCGRPLPARRQKWCSDECAVGPRGWFTLHEWARASAWALIRDQFRCRRCGDRAGATRHHWQYLTDRGWSKYEDCWDFTCTEPHGVSPGRLQVDHIVPRPRTTERLTYGRSCGHHPENLQTLCIPCHAIKGIIYRSIMTAIDRASVPALTSGGLVVQMTLYEAMQLDLRWSDEAP